MNYRCYAPDAHRNCQSGFENDETDENRLQCMISKPAIRPAVHNLRNTTELDGSN